MPDSPTWNNPDISPNPDPGEDALDFVLRAERGRSDLGVDRGRPDVLEVAQVWQDLVLDVQHHSPRAAPLTLGSATGHRWRLLGMPLGWVPASFARFAWMLAPMLSEAAEERRTDFAQPGEEYAFVAWEDGQPVCRVAPGWAGHLERDGVLRDLVSLDLARDEDGCALLPIRPGDRVVLDTGTGCFVLHLVPPGQRVPTRMRDRVDGPFLGFLGSVGFVGAMLGLVLASAPPTLDATTVELPDRFAEIFLQDPEMERSRPEPVQADPGGGAKAKREEGRRGREDGEMKVAKGDAAELDRRALDKEIAENAGVLGALRDGSELDGVLGATALDQGLLGGIGGLIGTKGVQLGSRGLSSRGSGLGGGGTAIGLGGLGTKGNRGGDSGYGRDAYSDGHLIKKHDGPIGSPSGDPIIVGGLDRALVDAVIRRNLEQVRYCYQRQLPRDPSLAGKVTVRFVIAGDGSVARAETKSTTLHDPSVEQCINERFLRFEFPAPKKNGIVIVTYPFLFAPG
ncbi:MAG: AgmX/PglI C-terminal domain-containing protein [Pseudomonadota bacterium]